MSVLINASTSTGLVQSADTSGEIELQSNGTTALKVNTNEGIQILNCLGVGNATPSTSGAGITFPATASSSSDANTLDDYEEGTFTPVVTGTSIVHVTQEGSYVKIGQFVFCNLNVRINSGTPNGQISGLPFVPDASTAAASVTANIYDPTGGISYPASRTYPSFYVNASSILVGGAGGSGQGDGGVTFSSSVRFNCTFSYRTTS